MIRWTLDEDIEGIRTDVVYTYENAELAARLFKEKSAEIKNCFWRS